jgi:hypothetical protein
MDTRLRLKNEPPITALKKRLDKEEKTEEKKSN